MKLNAYTKQVLIFLKARNEERFKNQSVDTICFYLNLNVDMVGKSLTKLLRAKLILRDRKGAGSRYIIPEQLKLGEIINTIQPIDIPDQKDTIINALNQTLI